MENHWDVVAYRFEWAPPWFRLLIWKTSWRLLVGIGAGSSRLVISYLHIEYYVELIGSHHLRIWMSAAIIRIIFSINIPGLIPRKRRWTIESPNKSSTYTILMGDIWIPAPPCTDERRPCLDNFLEVISKRFFYRGGADPKSHPVTHVSILHGSRPLDDQRRLVWVSNTLY